MKHIAVIGGGAAGSAVVGEILRQHRPEDVSITWLAGRRTLGRGVAYATSAGHHLLNVRAAGMGLFADDIGAFFKYAAARGLSVKASDFVPREWFGDFIESSLGELIAAGRSRGQSITVQCTEATAIRGSDALGYVISSRDGEELHADAAVVAIGALPPNPLGEIEHDAMCSGAYAFDAWQWPNAGSPQRIVVIGTGLTAVDAILQAASLWPEARITAISRHGRLPGTHLSEPGQPYEHQAELIETMLARPNVRRWSSLLREAASDENTDWRALIDGLRQATTPLWQALPANERARFLRHLRGLWELKRHRMPPQTAEAIERLRAEGRLTIATGRVAAIEGHGPLEVRIRSNDARSSGPLAADFVIQATGFNTSVGDTRHRLVRQLLDEGLVRADALGLGLAADHQGHLLRPDGTPMIGLRAIGTLLRGALWECTAFAEIRALARSIARDLPGDLRSGQSSTRTLRPIPRSPRVFALSRV
jgi:uncharacterized NAD(P)/FAD-binding protein YdhS